jgi:hypothetical protein
MRNAYKILVENLKGRDKVDGGEKYQNVRRGGGGDFLAR